MLANRDVLPPNCSDSIGAGRQRFAESGGDSGGRPAADCGVENVGHSGGPRRSNVVGDDDANVLQDPAPQEGAAPGRLRPAQRNVLIRSHERHLRMDLEDTGFPVGNGLYLKDQLPKGIRLGGDPVPTFSCGELVRLAKGRRLEQAETRRHEDRLPPWSNVLASQPVGWPTAPRVRPPNG